jgi:hypothetical protein
MFDDRKTGRLQPDAESKQAAENAAETESVPTADERAADAITATLFP